MKCLYCGKEFTPKRSDQKFDFPKCRLLYHRKHNLPVSNETDKSAETDKSKIVNETDKIKVPNFQTTHGYPYKKTDKMVYGKRAVIYPHEGNGVINSSGAEWTMRPEPKELDDMPDPDNRNYYKRKDGSEYWISATGEI